MMINHELFMLPNCAVEEKQGIEPTGILLIREFLHWVEYGARDVEAQWERAYQKNRLFPWSKPEVAIAEAKVWIGRLAFEQTILHIPKEITRIGAQEALVPIVSALPKPCISETLMNYRIGEALYWWGKFKPQERVVQYAFWGTFPQFTPHPEARKVLPELFSAW